MRWREERACVFLGRWVRSSQRHLLPCLFPDCKLGCQQGHLRLQRGDTGRSAHRVARLRGMLPSWSLQGPRPISISLSPRPDPHQLPRSSASEGSFI